jgi:hypothetical protein
MISFLLERESEPDTRCFGRSIPGLEILDKNAPGQSDIAFNGCVQLSDLRMIVLRGIDELLNRPPMAVGSTRSKVSSCGASVSEPNSFVRIHSQNCIQIGWLIGPEIKGSKLPPELVSNIFIGWELPVCRFRSKQQ